MNSRTRIIGLAAGVLAVLALRPAAGQNLVVNGDFEGAFVSETHLGLNFKVAEGWQWCAFPINGTSSDGRAYQGLGLGMDGSNCQRLRVIQNRTAESFMWQVINTVPGRTYTVRGYWTLAGAGGGTVGNPLFPWIGVFFVNGGTPGNTQEAFQANHDLVKTFLPDVSHNNPYRMQWPYEPPFVPTTPIIPENKEIVAEHAYFYPYYQPQLADATQLDYWETFYDAAGGANTPTDPVIGVNTATPGIGMPGIGESAENGGGAAWQTKVATGNHMIVGFFVLDCPSTTGDGTDLYIDNVEVTSAIVNSADLDRDGDVDAADFNLFESCASGPGIPHDGSVLSQIADFDFDGDIDQSDFAEFQSRYTGEQVPPGPNSVN
jgi:hypothetical protein